MVGVVKIKRFDWCRANSCTTKVFCIEFPQTHLFFRVGRRETIYIDTCYIYGFQIINNSAKNLSNACRIYNDQNVFMMQCFNKLCTTIKYFRLCYIKGDEMQCPHCIIKMIYSNPQYKPKSKDFTLFIKAF